MFSKVLIANRSEIACRIIRACRKLGISTVAVFSEADQNSLHVKLADEAFLLGPPSPKESYLNISRIISIARSSHSDAIHPGYGFLSQNPDFARACQEADIRFIGPYPYVMEIMEDKVKARNLAKRAGLPILPGTDSPVPDSLADSTARDLGFPLMVKAAQGGGGIGIRIINSPQELAPVLHQLRSVASNAFGSPHLYFERYMPNASHIEVQVLGDEHGNLVHLFERDCSVQRRNQKIVEESPSHVSKLSSHQRSLLWDYALRLARLIGYTNAGTVEFLASPEGEVYFLEMNTRLQVEHGVTELTTGLDLVELQLRIASGEYLPVSQDDVLSRGHAIEVRIYPEDPESFIPSAGTINDFHQPSGQHIRVDSALYPGYEVSTHYESLIAKLMCWGQTREEARVRMLDALDEFRLEGVKSNIPALRRVLTGTEFAQGSYDTGLLVRMAEAARLESGDGLSHGSRNGGTDKELAAAIGAALLVSMNGGSPVNRYHHGAWPSPWKLYGRRDQMLSRSLGGRAWR